MDFPIELMYTKTHEWIKKNDDGTALIGITEFASKALGDIVFVEFEADVGDEIPKGGVYCTIESVKAVESSYLPISGSIIEINEALEGDYTVLDSSPYEKGWLVKIKIVDQSEISSLLDAAAYSDIIKEEENK